MKYTQQLKIDVNRLKRRVMNEAKKEKKKEEINFIALLNRNTTGECKKGYEDIIRDFFLMNEIFFY